MSSMSDMLNDWTQGTHQPSVSKQDTHNTHQTAVQPWWTPVLFLNTDACL